jgi:hypothetical protein
MLRSVKSWAVAAALTVLVATSVWAADASGKWSWKSHSGATFYLDLKQDGEKLTGCGISEGKITKENELSFVVAFELNGLPYRRVFKGKLDGGTIKGTQIRIYDGEKRTEEWIATRDK